MAKKTTTDKKAEAAEETKAKKTKKVIVEAEVKAEKKPKAEPKPKAALKETKPKASAKAVEKVIEKEKTEVKEEIKVKEEVKVVEKTIEEKLMPKSAKKAEPAIVPFDGPSVRYSDEDLAMFDAVIHEHRHEALDELRMLKERLEDLTNYDFAEESMIYSMHMAEQGSEAMEKEKTYAQIQRINEHIKKLDEALLRIKEKTYGICRVCNCLIAKERLLAVPITTLSASYKIRNKCPEDGIDRVVPIKS